MFEFNPNHTRTSYALSDADIDRAEAEAAAQTSTEIAPEIVEMNRRATMARDAMAAGQFTMGNRADLYARLDQGFMCWVDAEVFNYHMNVLPPRIWDAVKQVQSEVRYIDFAIAEGTEIPTAYWCESVAGERQLFCQLMHKPPSMPESKMAEFGLEMERWYRFGGAECEVEGEPRLPDMHLPTNFGDPHGTYIHTDFPGVSVWEQMAWADADAFSDMMDSLKLEGADDLVDYIDRWLADVDRDCADYPPII